MRKMQLLLGSFVRIIMSCWTFNWWDWMWLFWTYEWYYFTVLFNFVHV